MNLVKASLSSFQYIYKRALAGEHGASLTPLNEMQEEGYTFYLTNNSAMGDTSGFAISSSGELCYLFSRGKTKGRDLVKAALLLGARRLSCFDGFLSTYYREFGFRVVERVANWTEGQPDVVTMHHKSRVQLNRSQLNNLI